MKIPISDYRQLIRIVNNGGDYYDLFECKNWNITYFKFWRKRTFGVAPSLIISENGLKGFIKVVLNKYKDEAKEETLC